MGLPTTLRYPILAIGDLHGQLRELDRLVEAMERRPEWRDCALVFLGDFVDRGPDSRGTIERVVELLARRPGGSAVMGNHDLAMVRAARLDGGPPSPYWSERYRADYDCCRTFKSYLGRPPGRNRDDWESDLESLRRAMPEAHREFLAGLPWVVESTGHLFLHCGLSPELRASPAEQVAAMKARRWERDEVRPFPGTDTDYLWEPEYPAWLGADRYLSTSPLPFPGKVQVTGHVRVTSPDASPVRIRLDTNGGIGSPSACLLRAPEAAPVFVSGK
jgi:serine/threonine protein phosphatase 1